jgi:predicted P-loop ATPase
MTVHQPKPSLDPWADGVKATDVPVAAKSDFSKVLFPEEPVVEPAINAAYAGWPAVDAPMVEFALFYARLGWHVFPCGRKAPLTPCDKDANGKKIRGTGGFYKASTDEAQIRAWWIEHPYAMIGVRAGEASGVFAIDPDGEVGLANWAAIVAKHGDVPRTHQHRTPGGGHHLVFKWHADRPIKGSSGQMKGQKIDVKGQGGYFIAPPSAGKNGKRYEIADLADFFEFAEAPEWLYELIIKKPTETPTKTATAGEPSTTDRALAMVAQQRSSLGSMATRPWVEAVLRGEYNAVASIPSEGCQNDQLNISSMKLGHYVAGGVIDEHEAVDIMMRACADNGLLDETGRYACMATIDSGMSFGKTEPKGIPERKTDNVVPLTTPARQVQRAGEPNWRERKVNGNPVPSMHNARLAITALGIVCSTDTFHNKTLFGYRDETFKHELQSIVGEVSDDGIIALRQLASDRFGFDLKAESTREAVKSLALENCFDPVRDLIDKAEAEWDGIERLDSMAVDYFNGEDTPINRAFVRKTMIGLVARARVPGIKFDTIMVLESKEGFNKSTAWRVLAGDENFSDESIIGKDAREVQEQLADVWIHENADLAGMKKAEVETVKAYASRQEDRARAAFAHFLKRQPRHSIEVGTTNSKEYLQSQTGNRRFWGMEVLKSIDIEKLKRDRLQLIGEAARYHSQGESVVLDEALWGAAADVQEERRTKDPWEDILAYIPQFVTKIEGYHEGSPIERTFRIVHHEDAGHSCDRHTVAASALMEHLLDIPISHQTTTNSMRLSAVMKQLGWDRHNNGNVYIGAKRLKGYWRDRAKGYWADKLRQQEENPS